MTTKSAFIIEAGKEIASVKTASFRAKRRVEPEAVRIRRQDFRIHTLLAQTRDIKSSTVSREELIKSIRVGIPATSIKLIANFVDIPMSDLADFLRINSRTLARRKGGVLNSEESEKVIRMGRVMERTSQIFGEDGVEWLKQPNKSLNGQTPISMLDTDIGTENVMDTLGRIEHGVFA